MTGMGKIGVSGSDKLTEAFARIQDIPFSVTAEALDAMAAVAVEEIRDTGLTMGVRDDDSDVHILDHIITKRAKKTDDGGRKRISFDGTRRRGNTDTRNGEIAFINEYGKRGQPARPFMRTALEQNAELISEPGEKIIGDWIENEYKK